MTSIHIRDVPPETLDALKRLAECNQRSLQHELHEILQRAAGQAPTAQDARLDLVTVRTGRSSVWSRDEIYGLDAR